jgi:hypothetical protein
LLFSNKQCTKYNLLKPKRITDEKKSNALDPTASAFMR